MLERTIDTLDNIKVQGYTLFESFHFVNVLVVLVQGRNIIDPIPQGLKFF